MEFFDGTNIVPMMRNRAPNKGKWFAGVAPSIVKELRAMTVRPLSEEWIMQTPGVLLQEARLRAAAKQLPYSGVLTPREAWQVLQELPAARLVDVRCSAEWHFVGVVPNATLIEYKTFPGMLENPHFLTQLKQQVDPESLVLFLCRTGGRSDQAARLAAAHGYSNAMNILEGFDGELDQQGHRARINGWRACGLPWVQS